MISVFSASAGVSALVVVMVAFGVRIVVQRTLQESLDLLASVSECSGIDLDALIHEHVPRSAADASADECLNTHSFEVSCQGSVSESVVPDDLG